MELLPHQREFVERVYSGNVRLAVSSVRGEMAKPVLSPDWFAATWSVLRLSPVALSTLPHAAPSRHRLSLLKSTRPSELSLSFGSSRSRQRRSGKRWRWERDLAPALSTRCCRGIRKPPTALRPAFGFTTSSASRLTGNCLTHYRRLRVSETARSALPSPPRRRMTGTPSHN